MTTQLHLLDSAPSWRLDPATRAQGLEGVRRARAVLRAAEARAVAEIERAEGAGRPPSVSVAAEAA